MKGSAVVRTEAIYKGATRPAMKFGIPLVPLVILFGGGMLLIMWGGTLVSWWVAVAVLVGKAQGVMGFAEARGAALPDFVNAVGAGVVGLGHHFPSVIGSRRMAQARPS